MRAKLLFAIEGFDSADFDLVIAAIEHLADLGQLLKIAGYCVLHQLVFRASGFCARHPGIFLLCSFQPLQLGAWSLELS